MARMTLSDFEAEIRNWIPEKLSASIKGAANLVLRELGRKGLSFSQTRTSITTTPKDTTPTVTVVQGSTSVTVDSGTFPTTNDGQVVKIQGSSSWFSISATIANTSFTISSAFPGSSGSAQTVIIAYPRVVLPADFVNVEDIREADRPPLTRIADEVFPGTATNPTTTRPQFYASVLAENTDDKLEIWLVDFPDSYYTYIVTGRKRLVLFGSSSSKSGLPEEHEDLLVAGALGYLWSQEDAEGRGAYWRGVYKDILKETRASMGPTYAGRIERVGSGPFFPWGNLPDVATVV